MTPTSEPTPTSARRPNDPEAANRADRRAFLWVAITFTAVIVLLTGALVVASEFGEQPNPQDQAAAQIQSPALDLPDSGQKPTSPGQRGGWEQLALLGLICAAFGGGVTYLVFSSRRARRRLATGPAHHGASAASVVVDGLGQQPQDRALDDGGGPGGREPPV